MPALPDLLKTGCIGLAAVLLAGCSTVDYFAHLAKGQYEVLAARRPLPDIIADPPTDPKLKERLELAQQARAFASDKLDLPRNGSYTIHPRVRRPHRAWDGVATAA